MVSISTIATFDLIVGSLAALGLLYLFYAETMVVHYRRFFRLITLGLLVYAVTGPVIGTFAPAFIHAIHGTAVLFIVLGLYDLVSEDVGGDADFETILSSVDAESDFESPREAGMELDDD